MQLELLSKRISSDETALVVELDVRYKYTIATLKNVVYHWAMSQTPAITVMELKIFACNWLHDN